MLRSRRQDNLVKKTESQLAHMLLSDYVSLYELQYKVKPSINRNKDTFGFKSIMHDLTYDEIVELLQYYFTLDVKGHTLKHFYNNYDKYIEYQIEAKKDAALRRELREQTKARVEEWRQKYGG